MLRIQESLEERGGPLHVVVVDVQNACGLLTLAGAGLGAPELDGAEVVLRG